MNKATEKIVKGVTGAEAKLKILEWLNTAKTMPLTSVGYDKDFALNRADWWLGVWLDLEKLR